MGSPFAPMPVAKCTSGASVVSGGLREFPETGRRRARNAAVGHRRVTQLFRDRFPRTPRGPGWGLAAQFVSKLTNRATAARPGSPDGARLKLDRQPFAGRHGVREEPAGALLLVADRRVVLH